MCRLQSGAPAAPHRRNETGETSETRETFLGKFRKSISFQAANFGRNGDRNDSCPFLPRHAPAALPKLVMAFVSSSCTSKTV